MKLSATEIMPAIGSAIEGGFHAGIIRIDGQRNQLTVASKVHQVEMAWCGSRKSVVGALSYCDGLANTLAMAAAGSHLAQYALDLRIDGVGGFYLPAQDELETIYRNLKPTAHENYMYGRSGVNASADVPTYPYTTTLPAQTLVEAFRAGGIEAFDEDWHWTSTQHADISDYAWMQNFGYGGQFNDSKSSSRLARFVRRLVIL